MASIHRHHPSIPKLPKQHKPLHPHHHQCSSHSLAKYRLSQIVPPLPAMRKLKSSFSMSATRHFGRRRFSSSGKRSSTAIPGLQLKKLPRLLASANMSTTSIRFEKRLRTLRLPRTTPPTLAPSQPHLTCAHKILNLSLDLFLPWCLLRSCRLLLEWNGQLCHHLAQSPMRRRLFANAKFSINLQSPNQVHLHALLLDAHTQSQSRILGHTSLSVITLARL